MFTVAQNDPERCAGLIANLPHEAKIWEDLSGGEYVSLSTQYLMKIELNTRANFWAKTKDAEKGRNAPQIDLPEFLKNATIQGEENKKKDKDEEMAEYLKKLKIARENNIPVERLLLSNSRDKF